MITCELAVCAESVVRDIETQSISVFNIRETMSAPTFPQTIPKLTCCFYLQREEGDPRRPDAFIRITHDEESIGEFQADVDFENKPRNRGIYVFRGVPVPGPGTLSAALYVEEREVGRWDIPVTQTGGPEMDETEPNDRE